MEKEIRAIVDAIKALDEALEVFQEIHGVDALLVHSAARSSLTIMVEQDNGEGRPVWVADFFGELKGAP